MSSKDIFEIVGVTLSIIFWAWVIFWVIPAIWKHGFGVAAKAAGKLAAKADEAKRTFSETRHKE